MGEALGCLDSAIDGAKKGPKTITKKTDVAEFTLRAPELFHTMVYFLAVSS